MTKPKNAPTWQAKLLRSTFSAKENRPRVMKSKKIYSRKGRPRPT